MKPGKDMGAWVLDAFGLLTQTRKTSEDVHCVVLGSRSLYKKKRGGQPVLRGKVLKGGKKN